MIKANFDFNNGWTFEATEEIDEHFGVSISNGDVERIDSTNLSFGITKLADGVETVSESWPLENMIWREVTSDHIFPYSCRQRGDISISVWAELNGVRYESEYSYVWEPDEQPYPSWSWDGQDWIPPVPLPEDAGFHYYHWDETNQEWLHIPEE